jgi:type I restriction enzyme, R subunit
VDRVVEAELRGSRQSELVAAIEPVVDRLMKSYKTAQEALEGARLMQNDKAAQETLNALILFKEDMGTFLRLYTFLSQIFDYGHTALEKRSLFFRRLLPLLEFGREREGIDMSKVILTHHNLKHLGQQPMNLVGSQVSPLRPVEEGGSGSVHEKQKAFLSEIIEQLNELFHLFTD